MRSIYVMRCGYCGVADADVGAELTYDHFRPVSKGGTDEPDNIVYACHACNEYKGDYWDETNSDRLLHPLRDALGEHLHFGVDSVISATTDLGGVYLRVLQLNRLPLVAYRRTCAREENSYRETVLVSEKLDRVLARLPARRRRS